MNLLTSKHLAIFISLIITSINGLSQEIKTKQAAKEIIDSAEICTLITLDKEGGARSRAMETLPIEDDFVIWLGTNPKSRKIAQIKNNNQVTVHYTDLDNSGYVTVYGNAELITDSNAIEQHWAKEWEAFYPDKTNDFVLIKITPTWLEVVSNSRHIYGDSITWKPPIVKFE